MIWPWPSSRVQLILREQKHIGSTFKSSNFSVKWRISANCFARAWNNKKNKLHAGWNVQNQLHSFHRTFKWPYLVKKHYQYSNKLWVRQWFHCIMYHIFLIIERSKMHKTNNKFSTIYSFVVVCCWVKHSSHTVPLSDQKCFINRWLMNSMGKGVIPCLTR